jgi:hypothetical protein
MIMENVVSMKPKLADEIRAQVVAAAAVATADDRKTVLEIVARAKTGVYGSELTTLPPA